MVLPSGCVIRSKRLCAPLAGSQRHEGAAWLSAAPPGTAAVPAKAAAIGGKGVPEEGLGGRRLQGAILIACAAGLCKSQQRAKEKTDGPVRLGIEAAHLLGDVVNSQKIEDGQDQIVEGRYDLRGSAGPHLAVILSQGDIPSPVQPVF